MVFQIAIRGGENFTEGIFIVLGVWNLRSSDFDHSNLFQS